MTFRSAEDQRKEYDLQAIRTVEINQRLQAAIDAGDPDSYKEKLEDLAVFANYLRPEAPEETYVILTSRPEVHFIAEGDGYSAKLCLNGNRQRFYLHNTTIAQGIDTAKAMRPGRQLLRMWEVVVPKLPENFIVCGLTGEPGVNAPEVDESLAHIHKYLNLGREEGSRYVLGIVKNGKVEPITFQEVKDLTGKTPDVLNQRFNVRKINWPGA
jgi:hypothetical protein